MRKILLVLLLLMQTLGCSGSEAVTPGPETPPVVPPVTPPEPEVVYVSSAAELKALGTLAAGSEVVWRDGVYTDALAEIKGAGTADAPVVLRAATPGGVRFTGESRITVSGSQVEVSGFWWQDPAPVKGKAVVTLAKGSTGCVLKDCAITGDNTAEEPSIDTKWVSVYGSGNRVEGCTFRDKRNIGTLLVIWLETGITPRHTIFGNSFSRPVTLYGPDEKAINGQETIRIGTSDFSMQDAECTVEDNYFYRCHGEQAEIISNKSCGNVYRRNYFYESKGTLTMRHGNNCTASGNYFIGNKMDGTGGIRLIGEGHTVEYNYLEGLAGSGYRAAICLVRGQQNAALSGYWQVKNATVRGNTIIDCRYAFNVNYGSGDQVLPVVTTRIENNTVSLSTSSYYAVNCATSPAPDITWNNNTIYGGKQNGVTLPVVSTPPAKPNVQAAMDAIRDNAGCTWTIE
ncbi:polysaccharide lyase 6 family protein [uncultured Alistipes sp.]|uniref:polysaccharide lyase 6 family protein n=1 Tax=uncultured Alistipes sp. TaxID=538949 RepID=UPI0025CD44C3|nr:polysaccharide lyase 6 family protein [uncultured Alistipes sp.]